MGISQLETLWLRGGFPESFLRPTDGSSFTWRRNFIRTFIERDLPQLGIRVLPTTLSRFWSMLAHYHGQVWNASELARSFGVTDKTIRHYLDILTASLVVHQLQPWHANIKKRQVKAPKIYLRDSGLLHALLDIRDREDLERHPKVGASWEGFLLRQVLELLEAEPEEAHFWATHTGAELDMLWVRGRKRWGFEFKRTSSPRLGKSLRTALESLELDHAFLVHAGDGTYPLHERVTAIAARRLLDDLPSP